MTYTPTMAIPLRSAADKGYALRRYSAVWGGSLEYLVITR